MMLSKTSYAKRRVCAKVGLHDPTIEHRGWALRYIYKVPYNRLAEYPPHVYTVAQAMDDIKACADGRRLPHFARVVRYDKIVGSKDPRVHTLTKMHGFKAKDLANGKILGALPYSVKDAQIDITYYAREGRPYYTIQKYPEVSVIDRQGRRRTWRNKGYSDGYKYNRLDPEGRWQSIRRLRDGTSRRFDLSKYRKVVGADGVPKWMIPCEKMPSMCVRGQKEFVYYGDGRNFAGRTSSASRPAQQASSRPNRTYSTSSTSGTPSTPGTPGTPSRANRARRASRSAEARARQAAAAAERQKTTTNKRQRQAYFVWYSQEMQRLKAQVDKLRANGVPNSDPRMQKLEMEKLSRLANRKSRYETGRNRRDAKSARESAEWHARNPGGNRS